MLIQFVKWRRRITFGNSVMLVGLTLLLGAVFKISAFAREVFITSQFGLSPVTDSYFALQQLPLTAVTYMFGPFARAFTPAYSDSYRKYGLVDWFPGVLVAGVLIGLLLTALSLEFAPLILGAFTRSGSWTTLATLSICYLPIILIGFRAAIWTSHGRNLRALTLTGCPYVLMTVALVGMYLTDSMGSLSLPVSMTIGFAVAGAVSLIAVIWTEGPFREVRNLFQPWKFGAFRHFTGQLAASSIETGAFSMSQFVMLYFMARAGTGAISANNCAARIGMLGYSVFALPVMQLVQARMCEGREEDHHLLVRRYLTGMAAGAVLFGVVVYTLRYQIIKLVYMRGNFSGTALEEVVAILPAWLCYFVFVSLNSVISLDMFHRSKGYRFTRNMLGGYLVANILRFTTAHAMGAAWIIWCAVIAEGGALLVNLLTSPDRGIYSSAPITIPQGQQM